MPTTLNDRATKIFPTCNTPEKIDGKLWELYQKHNMGVNEIGRLFCVDKATVSRRLALIRAKKGAEA